MVTLTASGNVEDYDVSAKQVIAANIAGVAGVALNLVEIDVSAGSVVITATINAPTQAVAAQAGTALAKQLTTTSAATALLPMGMTAESLPAIKLA